MIRWKCSLCKCSLISFTVFSPCRPQVLINPLKEHMYRWWMRWWWWWWNIAQWVINTIANENMVFHNALQVMSHIRSAVVNNIIIHYERSQILASNWIFDIVSEKYREKYEHINRHFYWWKYRYDIGHVKEKVSKIDMYVLIQLY